MRVSSRPRTLVLGGSGFIGGYAIAALRDHGIPVTVGSRHPQRAARRLPAIAADADVRGCRFERLLTPADWTPLLEDVDTVLNCVGILRPRGRETYERVHHLAPAALAAACGTRGIRLLHVSALGLDSDCRSGFLLSKRRGEAAVRSSGVAGVIVRPSLLDAPQGGYGARWIRLLARCPLLALPGDATGRIAALDVRDLGEALARLVMDPPGEGMSELEFGGPDAMPLVDYVASLRKSAGLRPATVIALPGWIARLAAHACDVLHLTPFSFGHLELLRRDNRPAVNHLAAVLGRPPRTPRMVDGPLPRATGESPVQEPSAAS